MIENLQRENLHFFEEAEGYQSLLREHGFTQEELANRLSKNQSTIANKLRILKLSRAVKERILSAGLSERHARALLRLHNEAAQIELIEKVAGEGLSVKATEDLVEKELKKLYEMCIRDRIYMMRGAIWERLQGRLWMSKLSIGFLKSSVWENRSEGKAE